MQEPALLTEMELRTKWEQALGPHYDVMVSKNVGEVMLTVAKCGSQLNIKQTVHQQEPPAVTHAVIKKKFDRPAKSGCRLLQLTPIGFELMC